MMLIICASGKHFLLREPYYASTYRALKSTKLSHNEIRMCATVHLKNMKTKNRIKREGSNSTCAIFSKTRTSSMHKQNEMITAFIVPTVGAKRTLINEKF